MAWNRRFPTKCCETAQALLATLRAFGSTTGSFDKSILPPNAERHVVSFGSKNKYNHPGPLARSSVLEAKKQFAEVNEKVDTKLIEIYRISALR
jgi:hypothetical protein